MRYWWVNQNQTYQHEVRGSYLWSPKRKANGAANPFYDFMREVAPGDVIFSFCDARICAVGIAVSSAYEAPKPAEFGLAGAYWEKIGWRVDVQYQELGVRVRPSEHMDLLGPSLPDRYAPLQKNGHGLQGVYLTRITEAFVSVLIGLIGAEARAIVSGLRTASEPTISPAIGLFEWEEHTLDQVKADNSLTETDRLAIVLARKGQGVFKQRVMRIESHCRVTGVRALEHLRASHCKPWRDANNDERLDGENGLLLTPTIDHLFDRGFIGFENSGKVIVSPIVHVESIRRMGIDSANPPMVGTFTEGQRKYLEYHRENVLLRSSFLHK